MKACFTVIAVKMVAKVMKLSCVSFFSSCSFSVIFVCGPLVSSSGESCRMDIFTFSQASTHPISHKINQY